MNIGHIKADSYLYTKINNKFKHEFYVSSLLEVVIYCERNETDRYEYREKTHIQFSENTTAANYNVFHCFVIILLNVIIRSGNTCSGQSQRQSLDVCSCLFPSLCSSSLSPWHDLRG